MEKEFESCIWGYHMYSTIWTPVLGELLSCKSELDNTEDRYIVIVCKVNNIIVGHIPKKISFLCAVFIKRVCGTIQCIVSAIYRHIFPTWLSALALQNHKENASFLWRFPCNNYQLPCWPPQLSSKEPVYLLDHGDLVNSHVFPLVWST